VRIDDPSKAAEVGKRIDALFENSSNETKTVTEKALAQSFADQIGNIGAIIRWILTAVFFTLLVVAGNTMAQSVRERTNEIAVLKTLGYTKQTIAGLVLIESFVITALGGVIGLGVAARFTDSIGELLAQFFPVLGIPTSAYVTGAVLIVALSLLAGLLPSMEASRLKITDALRKV